MGSLHRTHTYILAHHPRILLQISPPKALLPSTVRSKASLFSSPLLTKYFIHSATLPHGKYLYTFAFIPPAVWGPNGEGKEEEGAEGSEGPEGPEESEGSEGEEEEEEEKEGAEGAEVAEGEEEEGEKEGAEGEEEEEEEEEEGEEEREEEEGGEVRPAMMSSQPTSSAMPINWP